MASKSPDADLYGVPRPKTRPKDVIPSSTSNAFASHLTSLISSTTGSISGARSRPSKAPRKDDIFTTHNRNTKKRAAADLEPDNTSFEQKHSTSLGGPGSDNHRRARRKMEEKARLYAAMKRGDYVDSKGRYGGAGDEGGPLVDFDRKWAESEEARDGRADDTSSDEHDSDEEEMVEYIDEYGRLRKGTRTEAVREERRLRAQKAAREELAEMAARPVDSVEEGQQGGNIIFGDTVQAAAFNPDARIADAMAELARKRDRSLTPPEDTHYDAAKEVRSKGVGFYKFSLEKEDREKEMDSLGGMRKETEDLERERAERRKRREKEIEERRRKIKEKRGEREADRFLESLG